MANEYIEELKNIKTQVEGFDDLLASGTLSAPEQENVKRQRDSMYDRGVHIAQAGFKPSAADPLRAAAQGATLGFSDEMEAGVRSLFQDETYPEIREDIRGGMERYSQGYPSDAMAAEMIGGLAVPGMVSAKAISKAPSLLAQAGKTIGTGAAMGGGAGLGYSEAETLPGMAIDTAIGTTIGGLGGALMAGSPLLAKYGGEAIKKIRQEAPERANELIGDIMRESGWSQSKVMKALDDLGPEGTLADIDQNLLSRLAGTRQKSGAAAGLIEEAFEPRQAGAKERIIGSLEEVSGFDVGDYQKIARPVGEGSDLGGKVARQQARSAERMYGALDASTVPSEGISGVLDHERVKPLVREVLKDMNVGDDQAAKFLKQDNLPMSFIDNVKKKIDDKAQAAQRSGERNAARVWGERAKELRESADVFVPEYAAARKDYGAKQGMLDAAQMGRSIAKIKDEALELTPGKVAGMTHNEEQMFKMGVLADIAEEVNAGGGAKGTGFPAGKIRGTPQKEARLGLLAGDKADELEGVLGREAIFHDTYALTNPTTGSRTAILQAAEGQADEAASAGNAMMSAMQGDLPGLTRSLKSASGMSEEVATDIARKLTSKTLTSTDLSRMLKSGEINESGLQLLQRLMRGQSASMGALAPVTVGNAVGVLGTN